MKSKAIKILIISNNEYSNYIMSLLQKYENYNFEFITKPSIEEAFSLISLNFCDICIIDTEYNTTCLSRLKGIENTLETPPIILIFDKEIQYGKESLIVKYYNCKDLINKQDINSVTLIKSIQYCLGLIEDNCLYRDVVESSNQYGIIATDFDGSILLWNKGAEIIYGYSSKEMLGKNNLMSLHKKDPLDNNVLFISPDTFRSNKNDYRMTAVKKDGFSVPVSVTVSTLTNCSGQAAGHLIIVRDITKTKTQELYRDLLIEIAHLISSSMSIKSLCNAVVNAISNFLDIPIVFICLYNNETNQCAVSAQIGLTDNFSEHFCSFAHDDTEVPIDVMDCYNSFAQLTINTGRITEHSVFSYTNPDLKLDNNSYIIHIPLLSDINLLGILHIVVPSNRKDFFINETQVLSLISNEISAGIQRKRLEEEIKQYATSLENMVKIRTDQLRMKDAQLVQSGKLAALGEMATGIAHEINQPLGGINLMAQGLLMAKERGKLTDDILIEKLNSITQQIDKINKIITHLRAFAHQSGDSVQDVNVVNPMKDVFKLIGQQLISHNISIELDAPDDIPLIKADHNKLEQVFLNLISNARDALEERENKIKKLQKSGEPLPEWANNWNKQIAIRIYNTESEVLVEVKDNAGGIPQNLLSKIFEPFFTTKEVGKGTGLGLSISYGIIKEFGGKISVESQENLGTKFIISFPIPHNN